MNIVLDTNVLVAGLLAPFGPCGEIVRMVSSGDVTLFYDARIILEYGEVLHRQKFSFDKDRVAALLDYIEHNGKRTASSPLARALPDRDDEPFLEVTSAGGSHASLQEIVPTFLSSRVKESESFLHVSSWHFTKNTRDKK